MDVCSTHSLKRKQTTRDMKVTFIIPAYNVEAFLPRCLQSLASLLNDGHEAVLVDDGSTDATRAVAEAFATAHPQLRVVSQANSGQSAARNRALGMATGDYVFYVDADDYLDTAEARSVIAECRAAAESGQTPDAIVFGMQLHQADGTTSATPLPRRDFATGTDYFRQANRDATFRTFPWNKLFRRQCLTDWAIAFPEGRIYEDMQFNLQFFAQCRRVVQLTQCPYNYVLYNPNSSTSATRIQQRDFQALVAVEEATAWLDAFSTRSRRQAGNSKQSSPGSSQHSSDITSQHSSDITSLLSSDDTAFQVLVFSFISSCLLRKYIPLSFHHAEARPYVDRTMAHPLFRRAAHHCALRPNLGLRRWGMALAITLSPSLSRHLIYRLMP